MTDTLTELICASRHGDIAAFGQIVERFQRMACAVAYTVVSDTHLAEDAAQEAFIEAYQCLSSLRDPAAFPAWFRRIVYKRADRLVRGNRVELLQIEAAGQLPAAQSDLAQISEALELRRMVQQAIATLPEQDRLLVNLFHLGGYSQREVAAIVELPESLVKKRLFRARQLLRQVISERMPDLFQEQLSDCGLFTQAVQFFIAVRAGDQAQVQRMLDTTPALVNQRECWDEEQARQSRLPVVGSFTALHRAAFHGDARLTDLLLERGANPNAITSHGQTALHVAVSVDQPALVERLLRAGADPNAATDRGQTALHWAIIRKRHWHIRRLLAAGADPYAHDAEGRSPYDWAALRVIDLHKELEHV